MSLSFIFSDIDQANAFVGDVASSGSQALTVGNRRSGRGGLFGFVDGIASRYGGTYSGCPPSSTAREIWAHATEPYVHQQSLDKLAERDAITEGIVRIGPQATWARPPRSFDATIDGFLGDIWRLGWGKAAKAADMAQRRTIPGVSFVYVSSGGSPSQHIAEPGGSDWRRFEVIRADDISWSDCVMNWNDPDLPWGIEQLSVKDDQGNAFTIHGTRLIEFHEDVEARSPQASRPLLLALHDVLWRRLDIEFITSSRQFTSDPVVAEIEPELLKQGLDRVRLKTTDEDNTMAAIADVRSGETDVIGVMKAIRVRRLGKADVESPEWALRTLASAIALRTELTANMVITMSRGSEQITDADRLDHQDRIWMRQGEFAEPILRRLFRLAQLSGYVTRRRTRFPLELRWPFIRRLNEREEAFVLSRNATTLREAREAGRLPPAYVGEKFESDPDALPVGMVKARSPEEKARQQKELDDAEAELLNRPAKGDV